MYLCVLYGSQNKQRLFPHTALTDSFFITERESVYCAVRAECLIIIEVNRSTSSFNVLKALHF